MSNKVKGIKRSSFKSSGKDKKQKIEEKPISPESNVSPDSDSELDISQDSQDEAAPTESSDEDDLDDLDDLEDSEELQKEGEGEEEVEEEEGSEIDEQEIVDENKKTARESHLEQKKVLAERKLQRKSGEQVQQIKRLWEKLRVKKPAPVKEVRDKLCDEIWNLSKDCVLDLVMKHDASRVVQTLVKYSSMERRDRIVQSLKGTYYELATSSYGKYLLVKLLHYGSKESRSAIIDELHGKFRKLMRHKEGAYVVEDLYVLYATGPQRKQIMREFWGSSFAIFKDNTYDKSILEVCMESTEKRQVIMQNLYTTIKASVEKGSTGFQILHAVMKEYTSILQSDLELYDSQIREFVDLLAEQFAELVHTQEGSQVAAVLIAIANAKERKQIIKALKSHANELVKNEYGNSVLITLFMCVDDTVLLSRTFLNELITPEGISTILSDKFSRRPFLYLLYGFDSRFISPVLKNKLLDVEKIAYQKTSKKPQEQRREELSSKALPLIYKSLIEIHKSDGVSSFSQMLSSNLTSQSIALVILKSSDNSDINENLRAQLVDILFTVSVEGDVLEDYHLVNKVPFVSRLLKSLMQGNEFKWNNSTKKLERKDDAAKIPGVGIEFSLRLLNHLIEKNCLLDWSSGQGSFVIVSLYETLQASNEKSSFVKLQKALKKYRKNLEATTDNKGVDSLLKIIS